MSPRRVLVTGSSGFIGRALAARLVARGDNVTCLARPGSRPAPGCAVAATPDLTPGSLRRGLAGQTFDWVFHLAAYGVHLGQREIEAMISGTVTLPAALIAALDPVPGVFVQVGSCAEYDHVIPDRPIAETDSIRGESIYGAAKAAGAAFAAAVAAERGIPFQWLRLFGVYGPGEGEHRLPSIVIRSLLRNQPIPLSSGLQQRDLLFIDDVVEALIRAAEIGAAKRLGPFNICSGRPVTMRRVCEIIADQLKQPRTMLQFGAQALRPGEQTWMVGDNRAFALAGDWHPKVDLETGLGRLIHKLRNAPPAAPG